MSLSQWAARTYAEHGVAEACLELQDRCGQNVPLLLWAAWTAKTGRTLGASDVEAAVDLARAWTEAAVGPLRAVRRTLKTPPADLDRAAAEAVRDAVKAVELAAEFRLLDGLEAQSPQPGRSAAPPLEALIAVARAWGRTVPRPELERLAARLPE
jgi:uncharacterized protein (TIGR02444 family)